MVAGEAMVAAMVAAEEMAAGEETVAAAVAQVAVAGMAVFPLAEVRG